MKIFMKKMMEKLNTNKFLFTAVFLLSFFGLQASSFAEGQSFDTIMCNGYNLFNGSWGRIFALFALIALGVSFFLGKISWGTVLSVGLGIGVIFGGSAIVGTLTGASGGVTCGG